MQALNVNSVGRVTRCGPFCQRKLPSCWRNLNANLLAGKEDLEVWQAAKARGSEHLLWRMHAFDAVDRVSLTPLVNGGRRGVGELMSPLEVVCLSDSDPEDPPVAVVHLESDQESEESLKVVGETIGVKPLAPCSRALHDYNAAAEKEVRSIVDFFKKRKPFHGARLAEKKVGGRGLVLGDENDAPRGAVVQREGMGAARSRVGEKEADLDWLEPFGAPSKACEIGSSENRDGQKQTDVCNSEGRDSAVFPEWDEIGDENVDMNRSSSQAPEAGRGKRLKRTEKAGSGALTREERARNQSEKQAQKEAEKQRKLEARAAEKLRKEEEKKERQELNRQRKEEEKARREQAKAGAAERRKLEQEKSKWEKGRFAIENTVAFIDTKVVEKGTIGGPLLTRLSEKSLKYHIVANPISRTILWITKRPSADIEGNVPDEDEPEGSSQRDPCRDSQLQLEDVTIPYVLIVLEGEEFSSMVERNEVQKHVDSLQEHYPGFTVCYLINKLTWYLKQRDQAQYKQSISSWVRPPVEQALAEFVTHYSGVHSRLCLDEAEVADHIVGLMQNLAKTPFKPKLTYLSVSKNGEHVVKNDPHKAVIKRSPWLKALVALPRLSGACAMAIAKKYPNMRALLNAYLDPSMSTHTKELLLQDLTKEAPIGGNGSRLRVGPACSRRVYRIFMAQNGKLTTDDVEEGADHFQDY